MKNIVIFLMIIVSFSFILFDIGADSSKCTFGGKSTVLEDVFTQDLAVKAFTEKHQNIIREMPDSNSESPTNWFTLTTENNSIKETLKVRFGIDVDDCYIPSSYYYSYDDGIIDVTIRNSIGNFTEIVNLIKLDSKDITDFFSGECSFVDLDYTITDGKVYGICHEPNSILILADAYSEGQLKVDIPIEMVYSMPSQDCIPTGDFFVVDDISEIDYDIEPTDGGNSVTMNLQKGFYRIQIMGSVIIPNPSPAQYCGIVEGYDRKYLAPLDQTDRGVNSESIRCNDNLVLLQKYNGSPACVKPETKLKLIERGWTDSLPPCTSDRTACFNRDANLCDPKGWECGGIEGIFKEITN